MSNLLFALVLPLLVPVLGILFLGILFEKRELERKRKQFLTLLTVSKKRY